MIVDIEITDPVWYEEGKAPAVPAPQAGETR